MEITECKKTLLFVEDEKMIRTLFSRYFTKKYDVLLAENGIKGLELYNNNKIDVIVTDFKMPYMGGLELIKNIRKKNESIKIYAISGDSEDENKSLEIGANKFIQKPFLMNELEKLIN